MTIAEITAYLIGVVTLLGVINKYLVDARNKHDYPGLEHLPNGATIYDRASITRK